MAITLATTRADSRARHAERQHRTSILGLGSPKGQRRLRRAGAIVACLASLACSPGNGQVSYAPMGPATNAAYGAGTPTFPAFGPSGTTFGVKPRPFAASI